MMIDLKGIDYALRVLVHEYGMTLVDIDGQVAFRAHPTATEPGGVVCRVFWVGGDPADRREILIPASKLGSIPSVVDAIHAALAAASADLRPTDTWADLVAMGFRQDNADDESTRYCPCGETFSWSGGDPGLHAWMEAHRAHATREAARVSDIASLRKHLAERFRTTSDPVIDALYLISEQVNEVLGELRKRRS